MRDVRRIRSLLVAAVLFPAGAMFLGCDNPDVLRRLNPCLTVFNCDPLAFEDLFLDLQGGVNLDIDPTCTIPRRCGSIFPPPPGTGEPAETGGGLGGGGLGGGGFGGGGGGGGFGGGGGGFGGGFGT